MKQTKTDKDRKSYVDRIDLNSNIDVCFSSY